jgi:tetratricopeptide (TPR) repeat protein
VKAQEALTRALALDPEDEVARFALGALDLVRGKKREAYHTFADCLARSPNMWTLYHYFAYLFRLCDMLEEGLQSTRRAHESDPSVPWPHWTAIRIALVARDFATAREWLERARPRFAAHPRLHSMELAILTREGRYAEALEFDCHRSTAMETVSYSEFDRAFCHLRLGRKEEAMPHLERLESISDIDMDAAADTGILHAHLGDADSAFRHLARAAELGNDTLSLYADPEVLGPLHGDPRWMPFLEGVRTRVAMWRREFRWPPA